jgi:hypothetical protein
MTKKNHSNETREERNVAAFEAEMHSDDGSRLEEITALRRQIQDLERTIAELKASQAHSIASAAHDGATHPARAINDRD